jgi:negative regulator of sigma E activity
MTTNIPEKKARQGGLGKPVLGILVAALVLAAVAWGIAEMYGENIETPATQQQGAETPATSAPAAASGDKTDNVNVEPADQNPKVDRDPTPRSSTGGDQPGTQPAQPAAP